MSEGAREKDLILDPTQYAYVQDATNGRISVFVGPMKESLSNTDQPVVYDGNEFLQVRQAEVQKACPVAKQGAYIVLYNPATEEGRHPGTGKREQTAELDIGKQVVIPGPCSFALWPGQTARVLQGHQLRTNEYLIAEVVDEKEAKDNWDKMVVKTAGGTSGSDGGDGSDGDKPQETATKRLFGISADELVTGRRLIIKGTEVSFFIPPTGVQVVEGDRGDYVRDAVTLETLEYAILVDEDGNKRYERGPQVVFPKATEHFVKHAGDDGKETRKFKAIELNDNSGLYIKVVADYQDGDTKRKEGDELFITGKQQRIYFPRAEHAVIKYGAGDGRIFAIAIPKGDGRYVLDRDTGEVKLVIGPKMFLPDPRKEVIVRRVLEASTCDLWFPGNEQAKQINAQLQQQQRTTEAPEDVRNAISNFSGLLDPGVEELSRLIGASGQIKARRSKQLSEKAAQELVGEVITRKNNYTPPRSLVLETKYDGAVAISVWTGYAIMVVSKTGEREVVVGPKTKLLDYDQYLEAMALSTSKPKNTDNLYRTVYLRVINNKVGDIINAETADFVPVQVKVSYRVDFEGDPEKWFDSENYVKLLCDHARSLVRNQIKQMKLHEFIKDAPDVVRNTLLGMPKHRLTEEAKARAAMIEGDSEASPDDFESYRDGLFFPENGMRVSDVEVLKTNVNDATISDMVQRQRQTIVEKQIELASEEERLRVQIERERIEREGDRQTHETWKMHHELTKEKQQLDQDLAAKRLEDGKVREELDREITKVRVEVTRDKQKADLAAQKGRYEEEERHDKALAEARIAEIEARSNAVIAKIKAIGPDLIAAMQVHGDKVLMSSMLSELGAIAALSGDSVDGVFKKILHGSVMGGILEGDGNGSVKGGIAANAVTRAGLGRNRISEESTE